MEELVRAEEQRNRELLGRVRANLVRMRALAREGTLPNFGVGSYDMEARVNKRGEFNKLVSTRMGP